MQVFNYVLNSGFYDKCYFEFKKVVDAARHFTLNNGTGEKPMITITINSPGGDAWVLCKFVRLMNELKAEGYTVSTVVIGLAASAAGVIAISGSPGHRYMTKNSTLMLHELRTSSWWPQEDDQITEYITDKISKTIDGEVSKVMGKTVEEVADWLARDRYYSSEQSVEANLTDKII